jgi:hypothetical protein
MQFVLLALNFSMPVGVFGMLPPLGGLFFPSAGRLNDGGNCCPNACRGTELLAALAANLAPADNDLGASSSELGAATLGSNALAVPSLMPVCARIVFFASLRFSVALVAASISSQRLLLLAILLSTVASQPVNLTSNWSYPVSWSAANNNTIKILQPDGTPCSSWIVNHAPVPPSSSDDGASSLKLSFPTQPPGILRNKTVLVVNQGGLLAISAGGLLSYLAGGPLAASSVFPGVGSNTNVGKKETWGGGVRVAKDGLTVYFAQGCSVFRLRSEQNTIEHLAGAIDKGYDPDANPWAPDGSPAVLAPTGCWLAIALAEEIGALFYADIWNKVVRRVDLSLGTVTTVAGYLPPKAENRGNMSATADGALATNAVLGYPWGVEYWNGFIYIADSGYLLIRRVNLATNTISTVAGVLTTAVLNFAKGASASLPDGDGVPATSIGLIGIRAIVVDPRNGDLLIASDMRHTIQRVSAATGVITTVAGRKNIAGFAGDGGKATDALLNDPWGVGLFPDGSLVIADTANNAIRIVNGAGIITSVSGGPKDADGETMQGTAAVNQTGGAGAFSCLSAVLPNNHIVMGGGAGAGKAGGCLRELDPLTGRLFTIAGVCETTGFNGDNVLAATALFDLDGAPHVDLRNGDIYIPDSWNHLLRRLRNGFVHIVAGDTSDTGKPHVNELMSRYKISDEGARANGTPVFFPQGAFALPSGEVLLIEGLNRCIRRITTSGLIFSYIGRCGVISTGCMYSPDGTSARNAVLSGLGLTLAVAPDGTVIFSEGSMIRAVDPATGLLQTLAGIGCAALEAGVRPAPLLNNSLATTVKLNAVSVVLYAGEIVFTSASAVFVLRNSSLLIVAGTPGVAGTRDNSTSFDNPTSLAVGLHGELFVNEAGLQGLRMFPYGAPTLCPPGFSCSCGYNLDTCSDLDSFCPGNSSRRISTTPGYVTVFKPAWDGLTVSVAQTVCPEGFFCSGGVAVPCPPGTYGVWEMQISSGDCRTCAAGRYLAQSGGKAQTVGGTSSPCSPCPAGSTRFGSADGSVCHFCPPGSFSPAGSSSPCLACPNASISYNGAAACIPRSARDGEQIVGALYVFQRFLPVSTGDLDAAALRALTIQTSLPFSAFVVAILCTLVVSYNLFRGVKLTSILLTLLARLDQFKQEQKEDGSIVNNSTAVGGIATILGIGAVVSLMASSVTSYARANTLLQQAILPVTLSSLQSFADVPKAPLTMAGLPPDRSLARGFSLTITTMGSLCGVASNASFTLFASRFAYTPPPRPANASTLLRHSWACPDCTPNDQSAFSVSFHRSCQSFLVSVTTVTASGGFSLSSFNLSNGAPPSLLTRVSATIPLTLEVVQDQAGGADRRGDGLFVGGRSTSGFLSVAALDVGSQAGGSDDRVGAVLITLRLPLQPTFVLYTMTPLMTLGGLFSALAAWAGVFGSFMYVKTAFKVAEEVPQRAARLWGRPRAALADAGGGGAPPPAIPKSGSSAANLRFRASAMDPFRVGASEEPAPALSAVQAYLQNPLHGAGVWVRRRDTEDVWCVLANARVQLCRHVTHTARQPPSPPTHMHAHFFPFPCLCHPTPSPPSPSSPPLRRYVGPSGEAAWEPPAGATVVDEG